MTTSLARRVGAEFVGTYGLVTAGCGAIMVNSITGELGHIGIACTFGLIIMVMIAATGHLSGAHFNPSVTVAFALTRHFPWIEVPFYAAGQFGGAIAAALTLRLLFGPIANLGATVPSGSPWQSFGLEILLTACMMFVIISVATDTRAVGQLAALAIGGTIALDALWGGPISGASMNPARTFGPALIAGVWSSQWVYWFGPLIGATIGSVTYQILRKPLLPAAQTQPDEATSPASHIEPGVFLMNSMAIFGDIHANLPALEAVIVDMDARELPERYCLGDLVGYGTFPNEVVVAIRERGTPTLMGNYDQGVGNTSDDCGCAYTNPIAEALGKRSIAWTNQQTTEENKAFLRELPAHIPLPVRDMRIMLVHGSPRRINEYLFEDRPDKSLERLLDMVEADVLVCGHTHIPYHRVLPSGRHVVNAGSVGKPKDGDPRACYVLLDVTNGSLAVEFVRVPYDIERAAKAIEASAMPHEYAQMLRDGKG